MSSMSVNSRSRAEMSKIVDIHVAKRSQKKIFILKNVLVLNIVTKIRILNSFTVVCKNVYLKAKSSLEADKVLNPEQKKETAFKIIIINMSTNLKM
jgi:hypothetical protein